MTRSRSLRRPAERALGRARSALVGVLLAACSDDPVGGPRTGPPPGPDPEPAASCPPGSHAIDGDAAAPGGCRPAGLPPSACPPGEVAADAGCRPVGVPPEGCPAGSAPADEGRCVEAGVPPEACAPGFIGVEHGCTPVLPDRCALGSMALPGETRCRSVDECGDAPFPPLAAGEYGVHVMAGADPALADGSAAFPFATIGAALAVAGPGDVVAVAAGNYPETVLVQGSVTLRGRCAALVDVTGDDPEGPSVVVRDADAAVVEGLGVRGRLGIRVRRSDGVVLRRLWIHDVETTGIAAAGLDGPVTDLRIEDSLVENTGSIGVLTDSDVAARIARTVVRAPDRAEGAGVMVAAERGSGTLVVEGVVIEDAAEFGLFAEGADLQVDASVVRRTRPSPDGYHGEGVLLSPYSATPTPVRISRSYVDGSSYAGIRAAVPTRISATTVRRSGPDASGYSLGISVERYDAPVDVRIADCLVDDVERVGLGLFDVDAEVRRTRVRNVRASPTSPVGSRYEAAVLVHGAYGRESDDRPDWTDDVHVTFDGVIVEGAEPNGVQFFGVRGAIDGLLVRDARYPGHGEGTTALSVETSVLDVPAEVVVRRSALRDVIGLGIRDFGAALTVEDSEVEGVAPAENEAFPPAGVRSGLSLSGRAPTLVVRRTRLREAGRAGLVVHGGQAILEDVDVASLSDPIAFAVGLGAFGPDGIAVPLGTEVVLRATRTRVREVRGLGIWASGGEIGFVEGAIVGTEAWADVPGIGVLVDADGTGDLADAFVGGTTGSHVILSGGRLSVARTRFEDARTLPDGAFGQAVQALPESVGDTTRSYLDIRDSEIVGAWRTGLLLGPQTAAVVRGTRVADVRSSAADFFGDGMLVYGEAASASVEGCRIQGAERSGITNFGAHVVLGNSTIDCAGFPLQDGPFHDVPPTFFDAGGNLCGCGELTSVCASRRDTLAAPELTAPVRPPGGPP